jgi:N6-adenosine-specific RNA methylase IME4
MRPENGARAESATRADPDPRIERLPNRLDPEDRLPGDTAPARIERETPAAADIAATAGWADRIAAAWRKSVEGVIEAGRLLAAAKAALPRGVFLEMIERDLPFKARTAQRLMAIAADGRLTNATHVSLLPPHWGTLYALTKLSDQAFAAKLSTGEIHPEMERNALVTAEKRERRAAREIELGAFQAALPVKRFGVVYADPPWRWEAWSRVTGLDKNAESHYPTMSLDDIKALDVASIAADDCALFLWATAAAFDQALDAMKAWGFAYKTNWTWAKDHAGTGYWNRNQHEHLLLGTRGEPPAPAPGTQWPSLIEAPQGRHSEKPSIFCDLIEGYFPTLPKIELFCRGATRPGWAAWGNEAPGEAAP